MQSFLRIYLPCPGWAAPLASADRFLAAVVMPRLAICDAISI